MQIYTRTRPPKKLFMPFRLLAILFLFISFTAQAQGPRLIVTGKITRAESGEALSGALVLQGKSKKMAQANSKGTYAILVDLSTKPVLEFRFFGCESQKIAISGELLKKASNDTLRLDVQMKYSFFEKEGVTIRPRGADTVIGNWRFFIEDYLFAGDQYVLLTWEKSLEDARITLASESAGVIAQQRIPKPAKELFLDYQGHINVICEDAFYRVRIRENEITLYEMPVDDFISAIMPCIDTLDGLILFTNYNKNYPAFSYFTYNERDTTIKRFRLIMDEPLLGLYNYEFDYLNPKDRLYARKMEAYTGVDKRIIAASMTGFSKSLYYTPPYAPLFLTGDTVNIFDHYTNKLYKYNSRCEVLDSLPITYHKPKNWKDWDRKLLQDDITKVIYTVYEKDGVYFLKKINMKTGAIEGSYKLLNKYPKHLRVRNGYVYYINRPYESLQKKFLYREMIVLTQE
jgi:hypothetical protein